MLYRESVDSCTIVDGWGIVVQRGWWTVSKGGFTNLAEGGRAFYVSLCKEESRTVKQRSFLVKCITSFVLMASMSQPSLCAAKDGDFE